MQTQGSLIGKFLGGAEKGSASNMEIIGDTLYSKYWVGTSQAIMKRDRTRRQKYMRVGGRWQNVDIRVFLMNPVDNGRCLTKNHSWRVSNFIKYSYDGNDIEVFSIPFCNIALLEEYAVKNTIKYMKSYCRAQSRKMSSHWLSEVFRIHKDAEELLSGSRLLDTIGRANILSILKNIQRAQKIAIMEFRKGFESPKKLKRRMYAVNTRNKKLEKENQELKHAMGMVKESSSSNMIVNSLMRNAFIGPN